MKKKVLAVILAAALALTMAGCGGGGKSPAEDKEPEEITLDLTDAAQEEENPEEDLSKQNPSEEDLSKEADTKEAAVEDARDVTELLGTDELAQYKGQKVILRGMKSVDIEDAGGDLIRFLYNSKGTGDTGDDLYFCMEKDGETYSFIVKAEQCGPETEVYQAIETMEEEAVVDLVGYLEFIEYEGPNPDIIVAVTGVTPAK